jgi:hypothetical protein
MNTPTIISAVQSELQRHTWDFFVDNPPAIGHGGSGVVVPGCPKCRKRLNTLGQFIEHLSRDVVPGAIESAVSQPGMSPA